jgi:hypothetical protein
MDTADPTPSDPVLSLPPVKRAAYSDRTSVLMAEMSRLAYIPFEQPQDKDLDQAIGEIRAFLAIREHVDGRASAAPGILVLSFRGTEKKVQDWKTDLKARKTIMRMSGIPVH